MVWSKSCLIVFLFFVSKEALSQDKVFFETLPAPVGVKKSNSPSVDIAWYRWTTMNFSIHSLDKEQGKYLVANIEQMKDWCLERWGLTSSTFSAEARIFCVPDVDSMRKLFNLDHSMAEIREESGKLKISYLWLLLDGNPAEVIPPALTIVALKEFEYKHDVKFGWWIYRGVPALNATIPQIKRNCKYMEKKSKIFLTKKLLALTEEEWKKSNQELKDLYDSEATILCLLIRKEFGQNKMHQMLNNPSVVSVLGFDSFDSFDATFYRYSSNLIEDIKLNKTPDSYLQVVMVK